MNAPPRTTWLTLPQTAAYLDLPLDQVPAWADKHKVRQQLTGDSNTPDRNRAYRFDLASIDKACRKRKPTNLVRNVYPDRVVVRAGQAAQYLAVGRRTVNDMLTDGRLTAHDHTDGQRHALFLLSDLIDHTS